MYCTNCSTQNENGAGYCANCGSQLLGSAFVPMTDSGKNYGIAALISGILSIFLMYFTITLLVPLLLFMEFISAIMGIVFGAIGIYKESKARTGNGMAVVGLIISSNMLTLATILLLFMVVIFRIYGGNSMIEFM